MSHEKLTWQIYQLLLARAHLEGQIIIDKDDCGEFFLYPDGNKQYLPKKNYTIAEWKNLSPEKKAVLTKRITYWTTAEKLAKEKDGIYKARVEFPLKA